MTQDTRDSSSLPRRPRFSPRWLAAALIGFAAPALAQYVQGSRLVATGSVGAPAQGTSVALSADGSTAAIGGPANDNGAGAVWVYNRVNGVWVQGTTLLGTDVSYSLAAQGRSLAFSSDGNNLIVGGPTDNYGTGAMWVFTRANGVWSQQAKRWGSVPGGPGIHGNAGISDQGISVAVSADGNTALLGGHLTDNELGAAWLFTRSGGTWTILPAKLQGGGATALAHQGYSVALSGDGNTALVGGPGDNSGMGAAWFYAFSNGVWAQQGIKLTGAGATANASFGSAVALSADGTTAVIGASGDNNNAGALFVFTRSNGQWVQSGSKLIAADPNSRYLGASVAVAANGSTAVAGAPGALPALTRPQAIGASFVFARTNGAWSQQTELIGTGVSGSDALQGSSVALTADGTTVFIGGPADGTTGATWTFTRPAPPAPPAITAQPASQTIATGQTATLSVTASGSGPLIYQWYQGASGIISTPVGANSSTYTTPSLTVTTSYWVRVSSPYGSADSNSATVTVPTIGPLISRVTNAASQSLPIAPNSWVAIQGANLAPAGDTRIWQAPDFVNGLMPTQLDGVTVTVNGRSAYVYYISPTQVNVLTPPDALQGTVQVTLTNAGGATTPFSASAQALSPSLFLFNGGPYAAATHTNGAYLGPASLIPGASTPAKPGETIVLYGNGFGPTSAAVVSGSPQQSGTLPTPPLVSVGGIAATVQFAGLVSPGLYQFNVVVPPAALDGDNTLALTYNGITTQNGVLVAVAH